MEEGEKIQGKKRYKIKDLKVYNSTEYISENKKRYRMVFDKNELSYVYAELSFYNKSFDLENWDAELELKCFEKMAKEAKPVCDLVFTKKISKYDALVYIREGWGSKKEGQFWKAGVYYWEAYLDGDFVGNKFFYIEDTGQKKFDAAHYLKVKSARLFEGQYDDIDQQSKLSYTTFDADETRYVFLDLGFENNLNQVLWNCEVFVRFFNEAGDLKSTISKLRPVRKSESDFSMIFGFGSNTKGNWLPGRYRAEIVFMNKLLAIVVFNVDAEFIEGPTGLMIPVGDAANLVKVELDDGLSFDDHMASLDAMIGLTEIKKRIREHAQYLQFLKLRQSHGFKENEPSALYLVFTGNPGTGKTTIAKMMGQLYKKMGLLSKGHVMQVDRSDLVGEYIGQTAPKVKDAIEKARGGILFIDEAYALARSADDSKDFGREVIEMLVKEMSNGPGDLSVIVAGYPKEMKIFIDSNPGLKSRFKYYFDFPDYLPQELMRIAEYTCREKELTLSDGARTRLEEIIVESYRNRNLSFGNARFVNDLIEKAKINLGLRIMHKVKTKKAARSELMTITERDVASLVQDKTAVLPAIPIDHELLQRAMAELDNLLGMDQVKKQIKETVEVVKYYRESGRNVLASFYLHTIFVGNPGTGKTTVARILTKIYKALGILERGHIVETDRQGLVAGFVGQTAIKTTERINEAIGGVLFIDEAYALSNFNGLQGDYGNEAIQTLLKKMEDERGKFYVFAAGYPENMEVFLKANPGLSSRFDKILRFEDYTDLQLNDIALKMLKDEGYTLVPKAKEMMLNYCKDIYQKRDKFFGNARTIRKFTGEIIRQQNLRVSALPLESRTPRILSLITTEDLNVILPQQDEVIYKRRGISF
ncbi:MAG: AAA family ATPase [Saprospiraceae bacterium]|nr:AAA family ATPase [Saprospiraceae bacterium]